MEELFTADSCTETHNQ